MSTLTQLHRRYSELFIEWKVAKNQVFKVMLENELDNIRDQIVSYRSK